MSLNVKKELLINFVFLATMLFLHFNPLTQGLGPLKPRFSLKHAMTPMGSKLNHQYYIIFPRNVQTYFYSHKTNIQKYN